MLQKKLALILLLFFYICCKKQPMDCKTSKISIENRWSDKNGGIDHLDVKNEKDILFICNRINNFSEGKDVRISYHHGYLSLFINSQKTDIIFTVNNGIVYRVGAGKYVYDETLTKKIMTLMSIKKRCWGKDCDGIVNKMD